MYIILFANTRTYVTLSYTGFILFLRKAKQTSYICLGWSEWLSMWLNLSVQPVKEVRGRRTSFGSNWASIFFILSPIQYLPPYFFHSRSSIWGGWIDQYYKPASSGKNIFLKCSCLFYYPSFMLVDNWFHLNECCSYVEPHTNTFLCRNLTYMFTSQFHNFNLVASRLNIVFYNFIHFTYKLHDSHIGVIA